MIASIDWDLVALAVAVVVVKAIVLALGVWAIEAWSKRCRWRGHCWWSGGCVARVCRRCGVVDE